MANPYFTKTGNPANHSSGASSLIRAEIASIEGGFDAVDTDITALESTDTSLQAQVNKKPAKNFIINGRFNVNQNSAGIVGAVNGDFIGDVWVFGKTTTATHNLGVGTPGTMPSVADAGCKLTNAGIVRCSGTDVAIAAGDFTYLGAKIEGYNWLNLAEKPLKLGFWVWSHKTGTFCVALRNNGTDRSVVLEYTINSATTWEFKELTIPASPSDGTWDYTNGVGCHITWALMAGTTYHATAGSWQTGNFLATSNQVNFNDNDSNYFYITGVKLSAETTYSSIEPEDYQQELARVQRRYWRGLPCGSFNYAAYANNSSGACPVRFPVTMRAAPTLASDFTGITLSNSGTPVVASPTVEGCRMLAQSTAIHPNANFTFAADNYIEADARL